MQQHHDRKSDPEPEVHLTTRKATVSDAEGIASVARVLQIGDERPPEAGQTGFLLWAQEPDTYAERIEHSGLFVVAQEGDQIVGFIMAYPLSTLVSLSESMRYEDKVLKLFQEKYPPTLVYPDQIGVLPSHKRRGIGGMMDQELQSLCSTDEFATVIGHAPIRNLASIGYFTSQGFQFVEEVQQDDWTLGLYERNVMYCP
ncbi:GNAT family N-acetyltransferase [bacterium]|nr:GNAT family N-acetyltransferase [bacterium]